MNHSPSETTCSLNESFIQDMEDSSRESDLHFQSLEEKMNYQLARGLKKGIKLVFNKLNLIMDKKVKSLVQDELDMLF